MFVWTDIADAALRALIDHDRGLDAEQSPHGLDALDETDLHPILAGGLASTGFGVYREHHYPGPGSASTKTRQSERERCDLTLVERPGLRVFDGLSDRQAVASAKGTLFGEIAKLEAGELATDEVTSDEAAWIEIKAVAQTVYREGVPGPNSAYASELTKGPASDLKKLSRDEGIVYGAALVVLFARNDETVEHDLGQTAHKLLDTGLELETVCIRHAPMTDRVGNGCVGVLIASIPRRRHD